MARRKPIQRKVKSVGKDTKVHEEKKTEESGNEIEKMEMDESVEAVEKVKSVRKDTKVHEEKKTEESGNEIEKMEMDESVEAVGKDKLHQVIKKKKKIRVRRKGKNHGGMKFQILNMLENEADITKVKENEGDNILKNFAKIIKKRKNVSKELLNAKYQWEIMLSGIPVHWKGNIEELTNDYKKFNFQASALKRENWNRQFCKVLHLYFNNEEDMKKVVFSGPREILGMTVSLRVNPERMLYISNVPFDINEEKAYSELKEALGSSVYDITFPKNKEEKYLGHAVAYVIDEAAQKDLLDRCKKLHLWNGVQSCQTKEGFFKKFVVNVLSGWSENVKVLNDLVTTLGALEIQTSVDLKTKKLYFLDKSSAKRVSKMSDLLVNGRKMVFSQSHAVRFVMRCITRNTKKNEILDLLQNVNAFNVCYHEQRCKAIFDVPAEEVENCKNLNGTEFAGRKLEVFESGSEEMKICKAMSRKRFQKYVKQNDIKFKSGNRLKEIAEFYREHSKPGKGTASKSKKQKQTRNKISKKKVLNVT